MWKFALVLAVVHGAACIAPSTYWVLETLKCSELRVVVTPNRNLVETGEVLDQMCKRQDEFNSCLKKLVRNMEPATVSEWPAEITSERSIFNNLCSQNSPWRRRYLGFAPCVNMQQTDFCRTPEFLSADGTDLSHCAQIEEKMENCIAATLSMKCGVEAGQLFHYLMKTKAYDVCQSMETTYRDPDPSSNGSNSIESAFDEMYDQLIKRIGYIPAQDSEESSVMHKRVGDVHEESDSVDEGIQSSLEVETSDPYLQITESKDYSEKAEHSVSEVATSNLDAADATSDLPEEPNIFAIFDQLGLRIEDIVKQRDELIAKGARTLPSIIKDRIRIVHTLSPENYKNFRDDSENVEREVSEEYDSVSDDYGSVSEMISILDIADEISDEDLPEEPGMFAIFKYYGPKMQDIFKRRDELKARGVLILPSIIKDRFRSARLLKPEEIYETVRIFPDGRINYYSRRSDIKDLETIKCYNFPDYFVCINMPRSEYHRCLKTTVFTGPREGEFFPEEFDPEFGAQWHETIPKEAYLFEPWVHQSIEDVSDQLFYTSASVAEDAQTSYVPVDIRSDDGVELLEDVDTDTHIVSKDALSLSIKKDSDAYEFTTKENKAETIFHVFKVFTSALPSISKTEIKNLVPENVANALVNLYETNGASFENVKIRLDKLGNVYIFWNNQQESVIDTITCGKVNECHPKGEGIWKCVIVPRPSVETGVLGI